LARATVHVGDVAGTKVTHARKGEGDPYHLMLGQRYHILKRIRRTCALDPYFIFVRLARTMYAHRIWPHVLETFLLKVTCTFCITHKFGQPLSFRVMVGGAPAGVRALVSSKNELHAACSWNYALPRVGQNHKLRGIYGVHTVFLAGKSPYIQSDTVQIYGSGQPYKYPYSATLLTQVAGLLLIIYNVGKAFVNSRRQKKSLRESLSKSFSGLTSLATG
jgi:hypothetical protein